LSTSAQEWAVVGFLENALNMLTLNPNADLTQLLFPDESGQQQKAA